MNKKLLLSLGILLLSISAWGQDYIVTLQNDTIYGKVEILMPEQFSEDVIFVKDGDKTRYKAYQMLTAYIDSAMYQPVKLLNKYRLMKRIKAGYLSLYLYRPDESYEYSAKYLQKRTKEGMEVPNISFRKKLEGFLSDCPTLVAKIEDKTYKKADLPEIVDDYNQCLARKTKQIYADIEQDKPRVSDEHNNSKLSIIASIKGQLNNENTELITLLNDIKLKVTNGQKIPGYLITALKAQTQKIEAIQKDVEELLSMISE